MDYSGLIEDLKRKREAISDILNAFEKLDSLNTSMPVPAIINRLDSETPQPARQKTKHLPRRRAKHLLGQKIKACAKCGNIKNLDEFVKSKLCRDGHENTCLKCRRTQAREYQKQRRLREISSSPSLKTAKFDSKLECKLCHAPASSEEKLRSHMRTVHNIEF